MALSYNQALAYRLGYSARDFDALYTTHPLNIPVYTDDDKAVLDSIVAKLDVIDQNIEQNTQDSMATKVGNITVDYVRNLQILKSEGSRLLSELSQLAGFPIAYDKYLGLIPNSSTHPLTVRNYA